MRVVKRGKWSVTGRFWPSPVDKELVIATAALLGFTLVQSGGMWLLDQLPNRNRWSLYGAFEEVQGPWVPETDEEWMYALDRLRRDVFANPGRSWAREPTIEWEYSYAGSFAVRAGVAAP